MLARGIENKFGLISETLAHQQKTTSVWAGLGMQHFRKEKVYIALRSRAEEEYRPINRQKTAC